VTAAVLLGLLGGGTLGICIAPVWMILQLPIRTADVLGGSTNMRIYAVALALGSTIGALAPAGFLPEAAGIAATALSGVFVGMLAAGLTEAVEVVPALFDRLSITADMRIAAAALAIGKTVGAVAAGLMGG